MCKVMKTLYNGNYHNSSGAHNICFGENDEIVLAGSNNGKIFAWNINTGKVVKTYEGGHKSRITALSYNVLSTFMYSADEDGYVCYWS